MIILRFVCNNVPQNFLKSSSIHKSSSIDSDVTPLVSTSRD